jgi:hypothetical protein
MNNLISRFARLALLAAGVAFVASVAAPAAQAADAAKAPLSASFEKGSPGKNGGPYTLTVKNTSAQAVKASATVVYSVAVHNRPKTKDVPEHTLPAGKDMKIDDLSAGDKVTVKAAGFAPLELTVK